MGAAQMARWSGDTSERAQFYRMLMWQLESGRVSDASGWLPYRFKYHVSSLADASPFCFSRFSLEIFVFFGDFSYVFS
jgi:hypothetical protein